MMDATRAEFPNLQRYIEQKNIWAKFGQGKEYDLRHFTHADKAELLEDLKCGFSPENLSCDGELTGDRLRARIRSLKAVKAELEAFVCL